MADLTCVLRKCAVPLGSRSDMKIIEVNSQRRPEDHVENDSVSILFPSRAGCYR